MSDETPNRSHGLFVSIKTLAGTVLAIGQTRLELLSNDLEEERARLTSMLLWTLIALFCATLAVVLATLFVVVVFWDSYRLQAISVMTGIFVVCAVLAWRFVCKLSGSKPRIFSASLAELNKDREQLVQHHE